MADLPVPGESGRVSGMFGRVAGSYDLLNHLLSGGLDIAWRRAMVRALLTPGLPPGPLLDLAAGTLDVSIMLARHGDRTIVAADPCRPMLTRGVAKLTAETRGRIHPVEGDGLSLPLADGSVAGATIAFGIRNIRPRPEAFAELARVIRPGGRLMVLEFGTGKRRLWGGCYNFYLRRVLPVIGKIVSGDDEAYRYLAATISEFPHEDALAAEMRQAGFRDVTYRAMTGGIVFLHAGIKGA
ncbi:ubiquinone/menaquinone biosynthesis methyltransferase [Solidesulfovibrio carbinoliphilus subsp. oakridgensis]|uniref:Demethylmenaquinone methyltransferase n=1 Tax=Solidesulfovibrio carbinoliphilus subsp. oakridgensis TaxID=694327 RepID=G7Q979_9BACT|nr:ubiquinone/menaquinone biosynthesis methyltransferase [Solidesulfovibrio carbinoliphilus]EHJ47801.1 ubiquinone/menaquinone biosynthesis methyltransferase [Solidesulfovibrio carbinoliphilus subsp. oakridgensis]